MNYSKIKELCKQNDLELPMLASRIGMSTSGLYYSLDRKTLKVETLEQIANVFKVTVSVFFEEDEPLSNKDDCNDLRRKIQDLEEALQKLNNDLLRANQLISAREKMELMAMKMLGNLFNLPNPPKTVKDLGGRTIAEAFLALIEEPRIKQLFLETYNPNEIAKILEGTGIVESISSRSVSDWHNLKLSDTQINEPGIELKHIGKENKDV